MEGRGGGGAMMKMKIRNGRGGKKKPARRLNLILEDIFIFLKGKLEGGRGKDFFFQLTPLIYTPALPANGTI